MTIKKTIILFLLLMTAIFSKIKAQQFYPNSTTDTLWYGDERFLTGKIFYYGSIEDTILVAIKKDDGSILTVINENIKIKYTTHGFCDSMFLLLIKNYDFDRTDYDYPCIALFSNNHLDSIMVSQLCSTRELSSTFVASINCGVNHYPEIATLMDFFIYQANRISQLEESQYFMFTIGTFDKMKSQIDVDRSSTWIIIMDKKNNNMIFQYWDSYNLRMKRYIINNNDL
mgnify:CR=1 FL=1